MMVVSLMRLEVGRYISLLPGKQALEVSNHQAVLLAVIVQHGYINTCCVYCNLLYHLQLQGKVDYEQHLKRAVYELMQLNLQRS